MGAINENGDLFMWGEKLNGKLGIGETKDEDKYIFTPTKIENLNGKVKDVTCGFCFTLIILEKEKN